MKYNVQYIAIVQMRSFVLWEGVIEAHDREDARLLASRQARFSHDDYGVTPDGRTFNKREMERLADVLAYEIGPVDGSTK